MNTYEHFARVYDLYNTNYDWCFEFVEQAIREYADNARSLLELGCGTGNIAQHFAGGYEVAGLDLSASMLEKARKKLPRAQLFEMNMADFNLGRKYDVVLCMFDSLNHLLDYQDWLKTFACVRNHLDVGGVFIFDMNTRERLDRLADSPAFVQHEADSYLIMKVTRRAENVVNWNVKVFGRVKENLYELNEDDIQETSFAPNRVSEDLGKLFSEVHLRTNADGASLVRGRIFFVCKA